MLSGAVPLILNANPLPEAPAYTTGNQAAVSVRNSTHDAAEIWTLLTGGATNYDGLSAVLEDVSGTSITQMNAVAGYCSNARASKTSGVCVGVFSGGANTADGTATWGLDSILADSGVSGPLGRLQVGLEQDFHPGFINTQVIGTMESMDSRIQPRNADAYVAAASNGNPAFAEHEARWTNGHRCYDGAILGDCVLIGLSAPTASGTPISANSQPLGFVFTTAVAVATQAQIVATPTGLSIGRSDGLAYDTSTSGMFAAGSGFKVGGVQIVAGQQHGWGKPEGTLRRGVLNTETATPLEMAETLGALITDLRAHGLIAP